ncbi:MAG: hemerythrin domain-containing protein [Myxococcales bacterium]|nr:hemerythrin domain-containing protein [Myxococcales bacterium]
MSKVIDELDRDHRNLEALLHVLEHQLEQLRRGGDPDYRLIEEVLDYCTSYADQRHHPIEDRVYAALERDSGTIGELSRGLHEDHENLAALTATFHERIEDVLGDGMMPRDALIELGERFLTDYRNHMRLEERFLFPAAKKALSDGDWAAIGAAYEAIEDPVFGEAGEARFAALRAHIHALDRIE